MKESEKLTRQAFDQAETKEHRQNVSMEMVNQMFYKMCEMEDKINYICEYIKENATWA